MLHTESLSRRLTNLEKSLCFSSPLWQSKLNHTKAPLMQHECDHKRSQSTETLSTTPIPDYFPEQGASLSLKVAQAKAGAVLHLCMVRVTKRRWAGFCTVGIYWAGSIPSGWEGLRDLRGEARDIKSQPPVDTLERAVALKLVAQLHSSLPVFVMHRAMALCHSY